MISYVYLLQGSLNRYRNLYRSTIDMVRYHIIPYRIDTCTGLSKNEKKYSFPPWLYCLIRTEPNQARTG